MKVFVYFKIHSKLTALDALDEVTSGRIRSAWNEQDKLTMELHVPDTDWVPVTGLKHWDDHSRTFTWVNKYIYISTISILQLYTVSHVAAIFGQN